MAGIGDIGVSVTADTAQFTDGMNRTAQIAETSMRRVEQAQRIATAASDKFVNSLKYQVDTFGKSDSEILKYRANLLGASSAAAPLIAQLEALNKAAALSDGATGIRQSAHEMEGFSFKTAGAKRELLVLAHELSQGNFSKFGGSLLVLGERTGAAALLFNPLTLGVLAAGAALAALGYQVYKGSEEWHALGDAIKSTGDYTGYTQHQLDQMSIYFARSTAEIDSGREALIALVATGRFSGTQLSLAGRAALDLASDTGKSIDDVAKELAKLPDGAKKWAEEYQKTNHAFTAANIELIDSLDKQGRQAEAVSAVLNALDESHKRVAETMRKDKGTWDRFWDDWVEGINRIKNALHDLGKPDSNFEAINKALETREGLLSALKTNQARLDGSGGKDEYLKGQVADISAAIAVNLSYISSLRATGDAKRELAATNAKIAADGDQKIKTNNFLAGGTKSDLQKYKDQKDAENKSFQETIANLDKNSKDYEAVLKHHNENLAQIDADYAKKNKPKEYQDSAATKFLENLREQDAVIQEQLKGTNNLTSAQKEQAKFEQMITDLKGKKLTKDQESLLASKDAIRSQLGKNVADAEELRVKTEIQKLDEKSAQINLQIASFRSSQKEGFQTRLDAVGMGKDAQSQIAAITQIRKEYRKLQDDLIKSTPKDMLGSQQFIDEQQRIKDGLATSLADYDVYYAQLKNKQGDWRNGARQAFADYRDNAENIAGQVESALTGAFRGAEDAFVAFVTTGKLSFSSLATSIVADIARIEARKQLANLGSLALNFLGLGDSGGGDTYGPTPDGGNIAGARAGGGSVSAGASYLVGEKGPEIFTPPNAGTIIPNGAMGGGGGVQVNTTIQVSDNGTSSKSEGDGGNARQFADVINAQVRDVISRETRQGGILWKMQTGRA